VDHVLEIQHLVKGLRKTPLTDEEFHDLRTVSRSSSSDMIVD
jgi:hypothetical protein